VIRPESLLRYGHLWPTSSKSTRDNYSDRCVRCVSVLDGGSLDDALAEARTYESNPANRDF
jgi:hypothetical protein